MKGSNHTTVKGLIINIGLSSYIPCASLRSHSTQLSITFICSPSAVQIAVPVKVIPCSHELIGVMTRKNLNFVIVPVVMKVN